MEQPMKHYIGLDIRFWNFLGLWSGTSIHSFK